MLKLLWSDDEKSIKCKFIDGFITRNNTLFYISIAIKLFLYLKDKIKK